MVNVRTSFYRGSGLGDEKCHKKRMHRDQVENDYANDIPC